MTVPELIAAKKTPYYSALEKADKAEKSGKIDVKAMELLLSNLLARQLLDVHSHANDNKTARPSTTKRLH